MILEIHSIKYDYLKKINENNIITMDDGTYNQYYFHKQIKSEKKYLFPILNYVQESRKSTPSSVNYSAQEYMNMFRNGNRDSAITIDEIKEMMEDGFVIGCHSYFHDVVFNFDANQKVNSQWKNELIEGLNIDKEFKKRVTVRSKLSTVGLTNDSNMLRARTYNEYVNFIKQDTELCLEWFFKKINIQPKDYCFPFDESSETLIAILKSYGFTNFFGDNRIPIERLYDKQ